MLETKKIDALFCLLREMTRPLIDSPGAKPLLIMWLLLKNCLIGIFFLVIAHLWVLPSMWQRFEITSPDLHDIQLVLNCIFVILCLILVTVGLFYIIWIIIWHRKELILYFFPKNHTLHRDADFIKRLLKFDKATLTYGLLQYPHRWLLFEDVVPILVGDLRKLGIFPALTALLISTAILFKGDSSPLHLFLRDLVAIVVVYYVLAVFSFLSSRRPKQVIQLLEYAIQHADQGNLNPSEANTSASSG